MKNRIEQLRTTLGLSQDKFGEALGVTRTAVCAWENGRRGISEQTIISICREFNVNREWLVEGTGDMFSNLPQTIIDELAIQFDLTADEKKLVEDFVSLDKNQRKILMNFFTRDTDKSADEINNKQPIDYYGEVPDTAEELMKLYPTEELIDNKNDVG